MCVCVCVCVCGVCTRESVSVCVHLCVSVQTCKGMCTPVVIRLMHVCTLVRDTTVRVYMHLHACVCLYIRVHVCMPIINKD